MTETKSLFQEDLFCFDIINEEGNTEDKIRDAYFRIRDEMPEITDETRTRLFYHLFLASRYFQGDLGYCDHKVTMFFTERLYGLAKEGKHNIVSCKNLLNPEAVAIQMVLAMIAQEAADEALEEEAEEWTPGSTSFTKD